MSKVTVLGGCGGVGSMAVKTLVSGDYFGEIVIAENRFKEACELADELGSRVSAIEVDGEKPDSIKTAIGGSSVVLNCIGPFYRFGPPILKAVIESGINYVDICDEFDATEVMLPLDREARDVGISALIGMGSSPGVANVLVKFFSDNVLSEVDSIDIYHIHGGESVEGPAVVKHRMHSMESEIPVFLDGEFTTVRLFDKKWKALVVDTEFKDVGTYPVYPYPHPETITLPKYISGVKRVTNLGIVVPPEYFRMTMEMVRLGACSEEPIMVQGMQIIPREFAVAFVLSRREELLKRAGITGPFGCLKVVMKGKQDGEPHTYVFSMSSREQGMGEGTGIPAALGAILMGQGKIAKKGVFPPEAGVNPLDLLMLFNEVSKTMGTSGESPLSIEHIDREGNRSERSL